MPRGRGHTPSSRRGYGDRENEEEDRSGQEEPPSGVFSHKIRRMVVGFQGTRNGHRVSLHETELRPIFGSMEPGKNCPACGSGVGWLSVLLAATPTRIRCPRCAARLGYQASGVPIVLAATIIASCTTVGMVELVASGGLATVKNWAAFALMMLAVTVPLVLVVIFYCRRTKELRRVDEGFTLQVVVRSPSWKNLGLLILISLVWAVLWWKALRVWPVDWDTVPRGVVYTYWIADAIGQIAWDVALFAMLAFGIGALRASGISVRAVMYTALGLALAGLLIVGPAVVLWKISGVPAGVDDLARMNSSVLERIDGDDDLSPDRRRELMERIAKSWYVQTGELLEVRDDSGDWSSFSPRPDDEQERAAFRMTLARLERAHRELESRLFSSSFAFLLALGIGFMVRYRPAPGN